jgi:hypothetical protein
LCFDSDKNNKYAIIFICSINNSTMDPLWKLYDMYCDNYHDVYYLIGVIIQASHFYKINVKTKQSNVI